MKKIVSLILSLVMLMSITSGLNLTAYADDVNHYLDFQAEIYSSETAGFDNIFVGTDSSSFSRTLYNNLKNDKKFQVTLAAWSSTHIVDDATYTIENNVFKKKDLYDAILFDMIDSTDESTLCQQYQNEFEKLYKMVKNERSSYVIKTTDMILGKEKYTVEQLKTTDLSEDAKDLLLNGTKYAGVTSVISEVNKILGNVKNAYDAINAVADYLAIKDVDCGTSEILNEIASDSQSPIELRYSAAEISDCMAGAYGKTAALIAEGSISGIEFALNKAINYAWDSVLACIPGGTAISFGAKTGRMLVNYFFKTETVIQGYYQLEAAVNIEDAIIRVMQNKKNTDTGYTNIDSAVYMKSVDMYKDIILLGFDYSIELLQNAANSDFNTATDFWLGNYSQCMQLIDQIQELKQKKIDNFVKYEEIVFNKYKSLYLPNYDELEDEISKTVPVTALSVTQLVDINIGDSAYFEDCFAYNFEPYNYTESVTNVSVTSSDSNIISVVKGDDSKEKFVANNAGTCTLTFTLNDNVFDNVNVEIGYKQHCISDIITIGSYPKTLVTDSNLLSKLNSVEFEWKSYHYYSGNGTISTVSTSVANQGNLTKYLSMSESDYMKYSDVKLDGEMYRAVYFDSYRPVKTYYESIDSKTNQINNKYLKNKIYWFKYEPLHWKIFDNQKNLAICEDVIDSQCYQNEILNVSSHGIVRPSVTFANKYLDSSLDNYLSDEFYNSAFSVDEKKYILSQSINSSSSTSTTPEYAKVTVLNTTYTTNLTNASVDFSSLPTDYAKSQGVFVNNNYSNWWIRNDKEGYYAKLHYYDYNGKLVTADDTDVTNTGIGIRPVICFSEEFKNTFEYNHVKYLSDTSNSCYAVSCDDSVNDIVIPDTVFGMKVIGIKNEMFKNNKNLISVSLGNNISDIPREIFSGCNNLKNVILPNKLTKIPENAFRSCNNLNNLTIPNNVNSIGNSVFYGCTKLASITIPNSVTSIGDNAFRSCTSLTSVYYAGTEDEWNKITIGNDNENLTNATIHYNFEPKPLNKQTGSCGDNVTYSLDTETGVLTISGTGKMKDYSGEDSPFYQNSNIKSVIIENGVTSIGNLAFSSCNSLIEVSLPSSIISLGVSAFSGCENLMSISIPANVADIQSIAFAGCKKLTSIEVDSNNENYSSINGVLFDKNITELVCYPAGKNDASYTVPNTVKSFAYGSFYDCENLTNVIIPNGVTSIGGASFWNCKNLKSIVIPKSVTKIDLFSFNGCESLKDIYYTGTQDEWKNITIGDGNINLTSATIHYNFEPCTENQHNYYGEWKIIEEPTCTKVGLKQRTCSFDGYVQKEEIPAKGHTEVVINGYAATCEKSGLTDGKKCFVCGEVLEAQKEIAKLDHSYTKTVVEPTCTEQGYTIYKCETCGETKKADFVNAKGHDFSNNAQFCLNGCGTANPNYVAPDPSTAQTGSCGDNVLYSLNTETGVLTISGTGDMADYSLDNDSPFRQNSNIIKSVTIENGVTSIGNYSFSGCTNLINVTLPDSVTSIGSYAFEDCTSLTNVTIPDSVTSISGSAFYDCTSLTSVTIGNSVTSIGSSAFYNTAYYNDESNWDNGVLYLSNCLIDTNNDFNSTTDYTIKDGTRIIANHVFSNYTKLKSIMIPDSVTTIGDYAFYECTNLTNATIGNGVTSIGERAFNECKNLASITIPDSVISIGDWAFSECTNLTNATIGNGVTSIGYGTFEECTSLTDVTIPDSVISIGERAFYNCKSLKSVTIGNNVTNIGSSAFYGCNNLTNITIPDSVTNIGDEAFSWCTSLASVTIGNSVTSIGNGTFKDCEKLESVIIPDSVTNIGDEAFYECTKLTNAIIGNSVTSIGSAAFYECIRLTGVIIPNNVTNIGENAFCSCSGLTGIIIPDSVTNIGDSAFSDCSGLTSITIGNSVTSIGKNVFKWCAKLESVTIPNSVTSIGEEAFSVCSSLTSVTIPNTVTNIGDSAFDNCSKLNEVNYSGTVAQWKSITIGSNNSYLTNANIKCSNGDIVNSVIIDKIKYELNDDNTARVTGYIGTPYSLTIPESISYEGDTFKVTSIGEDAFAHCTSLSNITIPNSVTRIENYAFYGCKNLSDIYYIGTQQEWNKIYIGSTGNGCLPSATIHFSSIPTPEPTPTPTPEPTPTPTPTPTPEPTPTPNPAPQPSTQPTQETQQQVAQQTAQQQSTQNDTAAEQVNVAKPKSVSPKTVKSAKKAVSVEWKKVGGVKGYQIQVATDKKFKKNKKTVTIKKQKTTKTIVKKLKAKKKYYVRVRTYKIVNGKKVYSSWSKVKSVKTK